MTKKVCCRALPFVRRPPCSNIQFSSLSEADEPFYGRPRPMKNNEPRSIQDKVAIAIHYSAVAFSDPTRADAVAALGEITGPVTLHRLARQMKQDEVGKRILEDRPIVSKATIPYNKFIEEAPKENVDGPDVTFGQAYGFFLKSHDFDPDERDEVRFLEDEEHAYIMLRYRQVRPTLLILSSSNSMAHIISRSAILAVPRLLAYTYGTSTHGPRRVRLEVARTFSDRATNCSTVLNYRFFAARLRRTRRSFQSLRSVGLAAKPSNECFSPKRLL